MIRLVLFAPCQNFIAGEDHTSSLIQIVENVIVGGEIKGEIEANAGIPFKWTAMHLWYREEEVSESVMIETAVRVFGPDGTELMGGTVDFEVSNVHQRFRNTVNFPVFPIGQAGVYSMILEYRKKGEENWIKVGDYPITLIHSFKDKDDENTETKAEHEQPTVSEV